MRTSLIGVNLNDIFHCEDHDYGEFVTVIWSEKKLVYYIEYKGGNRYGLNICNLNCPPYRELYKNGNLKLILG